MDPAIFIAIYLPLFILLAHQRRTNDSSLLFKNKERSLAMRELAAQFIGKDCIFYTFNGTQITGTIKSISENGLLIENGKTMEILNLDLIVRIREHPRDKKGKKKSVVLD